VVVEEKVSCWITHYLRPNRKFIFLCINSTQTFFFRFSLQEVCQGGRSIKTQILCAILALSAIGVVTGTDYSHQYDTFKMGFQTPPGITAQIDWGKGDSFLPIDIKLSNGDILFPWPPRQFYDWESRDVTNDNLEKIWAPGADNDQHSAPSVTKLDNGDYIVTGRMMRMGSMITRVTRTFDFDKDGKLDSYIQWNGQDKVNYDTMNYLASTTSVEFTEPNWN
jgi:hypothetical protein